MEKKTLQDAPTETTDLALNTPLPTEPTAAQIDAWKKKHGDVFLIAVESGETCYLRKPNRQDISAAQASARKDPMKFNESLLLNCWLAGDETIRTDDELFFAASHVLDEVLVFKTATAKKL